MAYRKLKIYDQPMFWEGEVVLGDTLIAYRGRAADNKLHAHASIQITVSASTPVVLRNSHDGVHESNGLIVRPGVPHALAPNEHVTIILIEPQSQLAQNLLERCSPDDISQLPIELEKSLLRRIPLNDLVSDIQQQVPARGIEIDPRLATALDYLKSARLKNGVKNAAAASGLSEARLRAIAQKQLQVPLSKWLLWRAVGKAGRAVASGETLAAAAVAGGFADQAHYTRTLNRLMGVTPTQARHPLR